MPETNRAVRVFISSTFRDMHAERDHLVTVVFPEMRERVERLGLEFFDVDLRWGVPEKGADGETANSWEYCRQWIERVEPFFVCMLGQRYGWVPEPEKLKDEADCERQTGDPRSITDMEVRYAVLDTQLNRRSYFYLRDAEAPATATDFVEDEQPLIEKLDQLKHEVRGSGRVVRDYPCQWKDEAFTGMDAFGRMVLDDLWSGVLRDERYVSKDVWREALGGADPDGDPRYTDEAMPVPEDLAEKIVDLAKPPPKDPLDAERGQMDAFAASRIRGFQGRTKELAELKSFILDPAEDSAPRLAVLAAVPGQGKSALIAKLCEDLTEKEDSPLLDPSDALVITHFVGATEQSSTAYALVKRLLDVLDRSGIEWPEPPQHEGQPAEEPKLDFNSLCLRLAERLGDYAGERRIVLLLDALNQLTDGHDLGWLPHRFGPGVRIVVSCIDDPASKEDRPERQVLAALTARRPEPKRVSLGGLDEQDVRSIVEGYLLEYCKELDQSYVDAICDEAKLPQARNPLYLIVMLAELRSLGGNEMNEIVPSLIAEMATKHPDTVSLFKWVLQRMEVAEGFGPEAVKWWCLYLALGRAGMASRELSDLLARKLGPDAALTAQRIERGLRRYLQRRSETLDVFHGQLRQAVKEKYGDVADKIKGHGEIAGYFRSLADPHKDQSWSGISQRSFNEIAFHLIGTQQWDELCDYLTDFRCLDGRIRAGQVFEVVTDHRAAIAALPELNEEARRERERVEICAQYGKNLITYARACAEGKNPSLPEPPDTREPPAAEANSEEHSPRADRLRAIANFTGQQATLLAVFPRDFLTLAANAADGTPLSDAALAADAVGHPWLHRHLRPPTPPLKPQCLATLQGHTSWVNSVALTPDGSSALSGSGDKTLRVWDLASGQCLATLQGHTSQVTSVALSPDGSRAVSGGDYQDNTLRVWDLASGQCLAILEGHMGHVNSVALSPDGSRAVSGGNDNTLRVWDLKSGQCLATLQGHTSAVNSVALTPDGSRAVSGSWDKTLRVWDLASGQCLANLQGHTDRVTSVALTPDGSRALSSSSDAFPSGNMFRNEDKTLRVWDLASGQCIATLQGHTGRVTSVDLSPDGSRAVSGSEDETLRVWDLDSGQCLATLKGHTGSVGSVALSPDGSRALSGGGDETLRVWDLDTGQCLATLQGHAGQVKSVAITPDGSRAVSGSWDKTLRVWDLDTGQCLANLQGHTEGVTSVSLSPDGSRALSGGGDETLRVWDLDTGQCLKTLRGDTNGVNSVALSPDGSRALSGGGRMYRIGDNTLRVWDLDTGQCLATLQGHTDEVNSVALSPDGSRAVSASEDKALRVWDLASGQCLATLKGHTDRVTSVALTPDGSRAVSGGNDNTLRVWDLDSGQCIAILEGHTKGVDSVAISPDGSRAVSGGSDTTLCVWDLASGQCLAIYHAGAGVQAVAISPTDGRIVCGTQDGQMHFLTMRNFPEAG